MPSVHQGSSANAYEPSEYADEYSTDPAKILAKNAETVEAVIRGIDDMDLLTAYQEVEIDRHRRQEVIGAINQRKQEIRQANTCPRGCDEPVIDRADHEQPFQIKHVNAVQYKTCVIPNDDGTATVVFHHPPEEDEGDDGADDEGEGGDRLSEAESDDKSDGGDGDESADTDDLPVGETPKQMYLKMRSTDGTMNLAGIQGWAATELELSPDESEHHLESLVNGGYVEEIEEGMYRSQ